MTQTHTGSMWDFMPTLDEKKTIAPAPEVIAHSEPLEPLNGIMDELTFKTDLLDKVLLSLEVNTVRVIYIDSNKKQNYSIVDGVIQGKLDGKLIVKHQVNYDLTYIDFVDIIIIAELGNHTFYDFDKRYQDYREKAGE
ncbi:hypothetical protein [Bacillus phage Megatron]|uniref:Uncharacterized protein n=3 Tax=Wphvirus megatron TaxID=1987728 RepID=A0A024B381_9CAUD|nr:hypothetical protein FP75_gp275 [Bacillus phage Megatron]YP_009285227.1 hypothetical protein BIZ88_gp285 [Bacillus phage DirtyBetty]AHZ10857.1 hypothetical protein [Bacillus phage Megatron]ANI24894.1 hypothetical protein SMUDGE_275 [Bacillus phage Smudge]ANT41466.1 hypothetical protein DIRTYBETTY_285 [Bacillus phage DirtyBetty]